MTPHQAALLVSHDLPLGKSFFSGGTITSPVDGVEQGLALVPLEKFVRRLFDHGLEYPAGT